MILALEPDRPIRAAKFCSIEPITMVALGSLAAPLIGKAVGGGSSGGGSSGAIGREQIDQRQNTALDIVNNLVGSPVTVNVGSRQTMPDASLGGQAAYGYLPDSQMVDLLPFGSLRGNLLQRVSNTLADPMANGGWNPLTPPWERMPEGTPQETRRNKTTVIVVAAIALTVGVLIFRKG